MASAEVWIAILKREAAELRRLGILSIACDGNSAVLAPAGPDVDDGATTAAPTGVTADAEEASNAWENPASYPSGHVPTLGDVDPADKLPEIHEFGDA